MDSMRHLSTSLPHSSRRKNEAELLSSFKAAAFSVTNLFKAAAADSAHARDAGYQDALGDLLAYMDAEKIGLNDGEGWNVRRWLLQRIEDAPGKTTSDDGEESQREDDRAASVDVHKPSAEAEETAARQAEDQRSARRSASPVLVTSVPSKDFTFRSTTQYPTNHDREGTMEIDVPAPNTRYSKGSKSRHRRDGKPSQASILSLGSATGSKRKLPFPDFFDISGITFDTSDKHDGSRGGKRARQA